MNQTTETAPATGAGASGARKGGLNAMLLPELKQLAGGLGIKATGMRKGPLIEAIKTAQGGGQSSKGDSAKQGANEPAAGTERPADGSERSENANPKRNDGQNNDGQNNDGQQNDGQQKARQRNDGQDNGGQDNDGQNNDGQNKNGRRNDGKQGRQGNRQGGDQQDRSQDGGSDNRGNDRSKDNRNEQRSQDNRNQDNRSDNRSDGRSDDRSDERGSARQNQGGGNRNQDNRNQDSRNQDRNQGGANRNQGGNRTDDDDGGSRRNRRRRGRDRGGNQQSAGGGGGGTQSNRGTRSEPDMQVLEDDVLAPCAGILDLMDNYAFVRTSGYLPGSDDVYVSMSMVRKFGMRRGDAITGQVRQPREGERREKYNPLVKLDSVNGADPEESKTRVEFSKLTPLYPSERLRLETTSTNLIGRVIDIAAPIGKGQRGLIVSPSKAGKTMIMQSVANSITTNNPECHLMVVLVDERPEEVTDFERSVKGEVVSSTFDRPASDHTIVAELAIERAKRLVELGHDVVVLLDGITRLGRAYNLAAPASGRILSGGVDSAALYPPKRFFGAARNIEDGGSLTILATALIESGSKMDEVIFEEFKGTGNMEIRLRRDFADKRIFPAIDAVQSGTRREELLMSKEELSIVWKLRRVLSGLDGQQALELLLERLKKSKTNLEFLMQVQKTTPTASGQDD